MVTALRVGAHIGKCVAIGRPVPDDVVGAAAGLGVVVASRHRITDQLLAVGQAERIDLESVAPNVTRHIGFVEHRAPGDIAGVSGLELGQILRAHRRADTIGTDQQRAVLARTVGEHCGDAAAVLFDARKPFAKPVALRRQRLAQGAIKACPGAHGARRRLFDECLAVAIEAHRFSQLDAHRFVEGNAGAAQDGDELWMRAEADAAARQFLFVAFEHDGVPAGAAQKMRGKEPAKRTADHQRTPHL